MRGFWVVLFALAILLASDLRADDGEGPVQAALPRGRTIWGFGGSVALATGDRASGFGAAVVRIDRVVSAPRGPGWLRGQLGYSIELLPLLVLSEGENAYSTGFTLLGRHYLGSGTNGSLRPFITLGAGLLVSSRDVPEGVTQVNFTPQLGFGFLVSPHGRTFYFLEVRLHHLSNGGRVRPNPGINSAMVEVGVSFAARQR